MKTRLLMLAALVVLAFSCVEEEVEPTLEISEQESLITIDKFVIDPVITPNPFFPVANDSLKNIYDITLTSGAQTFEGILDIDAGNAFSDNFVNDATLTIEGEVFDLIRRNVAISNGVGSFRFVFENGDGDKITLNLNGSLGRSLGGSFSFSGTGLPSSGLVSASSQGDPFRIDLSGLVLDIQL
ncbi:MAG: hypothetical protein WBA74_01265 [Cyclobacteriaceae bacterium]